MIRSAEAFVLSLATELHGKPVYDLADAKGLLDPQSHVPRLRVTKTKVKKSRAEPEIERQLALIADDPVGHQQRELILGNWGWSADSGFALRSIASTFPNLEQLTHLMLGDLAAEECEMSWIEQW